MRIFRGFIQLAIGIAILLWLLQLADATKVLASISMANTLYIFAAIMSFFTASMMVALAFFVSLKKVGVKTKIGDAILASFGGQLLSDITPARSGYFLTSFILNRIDRTSHSSGMACVVTTGAMNFLVKASLSLISLAYLVRILPISPTVMNSLIIGISILAAGGIGLLALLWGKHLPGFLDKFKKIPIAGKLISRIADVLNNLQEEAGKARGSLTLVASLILLSIIANSMALYFISKSLELNSPTFLDFMIITPLVSAFSFVPITIAGLGIQEAGYVILLGLLGVSIEKAVAFTLVNRLLFIATDMIGLISLFKMGMGIKYSMLNHAKYEKLTSKFGNGRSYEKKLGEVEEISRFKPFYQKNLSDDGN